MFISMLSQKSKFCFTISCCDIIFCYKDKAFAVIYYYINPQFILKTMLENTKQLVL